MFLPLPSLPGAKGAMHTSTCPPALPDQPQLSTSIWSAVKEKKGKKADRLESRVPDPAKWDTADSQTPPVQTLWKPEKMKKLTYTQFWNLVKERKVDRVCHTAPSRPPCCVSCSCCPAPC